MNITEETLRKKFIEVLHNSHKGITTDSIDDQKYLEGHNITVGAEIMLQGIVSEGDINQMRLDVFRQYHDIYGYRLDLKKEK